MSELFALLPTPRGGIIGHRGMTARAPENTLAGFNAAAAFGLNWVEFDIQRCASGEWVVIHDETLDRTTQGHGFVKDTPYHILTAYNVPSLPLALSCMVDRKLHPNIEIKVFTDNLNTQKAAMTHFLETLQAAWPNTLAKPLVSSFDWTSLQILRSLDSTLPLGYIIEQPTENTLDLIVQEKFDSLHCDYRNLSTVLLEKAKSLAIPILVYTVNNQQTLNNLQQMGVTAVFSDITEDVHL